MYRGFKDLVDDETEPDPKKEMYMEFKCLKR